MDSFKGFLVERRRVLGTKSQICHERVGLLQSNKIATNVKIISFSLSPNFHSFRLSNLKSLLRLSLKFAVLLFMSFTLLIYCHNYVEQSSRRMANITYCLWIVSVFLAFLSLLVIQMKFPQTGKSYKSKIWVGYVNLWFFDFPPLVKVISTFGGSEEGLQHFWYCPEFLSSLVYY